jgi:hypothetical protein
MLQLEGNIRSIKRATFNTAKLLFLRFKSCRRITLIHSLLGKAMKLAPSQQHKLESPEPIGAQPTEIRLRICMVPGVKVGIGILLTIIIPIELIHTHTTRPEDTTGTFRLIPMSTLILITG